MTNTVFEISLLGDYTKVDGDVSTSLNEVLVCPLLNTGQGRMMNDPVWCLQKSLFNSTGYGAEG